MPSVKRRKIARAVRVEFLDPFDRLEVPRRLEERRPIEVRRQGRSLGSTIDMLSNSDRGVPGVRDLAVLTFLTLDGVMQAPVQREEDPSGSFTHGGWSVNYWDEVMAQVMEEAMAAPYDCAFR